VEPVTLIDISAAVNQGAGIGRYAREITRALIPMFAPESTQLWLASDPVPAHPGLLNQPPWNSLPVRRSRLSRQNFDRFVMRWRVPAGLLLVTGTPLNSYSPDFTAPPGKREHVTVHDLAWLHPEAETPPPLAQFLAPVVDRTIRRASTIFTVSHAVRDEILERYGVLPENVIVASNAAASPFFEPPPLSAAELSGLGIRDAFLLFVGTIEGRKNLSVLLEALAQLPETLTLVVVGKDGWNASQQLEPIQRLHLHERVIRPGYVEDRMLPGLYAAASAVVYPSKYEGFGLPIIEGLATGAPVVATDLPVFREVGGKEVEYFDSGDPLALAAAIERVVFDQSQGDEAARKRRQEQARTFDWKSSAEVVARRLQEDY
jgi:glycosyltransferase involved in cell wall biosynthesis